MKECEASPPASTVRNRLITIFVVLDHWSDSLVGPVKTVLQFKYLIYQVNFFVVQDGHPLVFLLKVAMKKKENSIRLEAREIRVNIIVKVVLKY